MHATACFSEYYTWEQLCKEQEADAELCSLIEETVNEEAARYGNCFCITSGVLMRKWRLRDAPASDEWRVIQQIVLPHWWRRGVTSVAHDPPLGGHLGVNKTYHKVLPHFYWPTMKWDVAQFCSTSHTCQVVSKPRQCQATSTYWPLHVKLLIFLRLFH